MGNEQEQREVTTQPDGSLPLPVINARDIGYLRGVFDTHEQRLDRVEGDVAMLKADTRTIHASLADLTSKLDRHIEHSTRTMDGLSGAVHHLTELWGELAASIKGLANILTLREAADKRFESFLDDQDKHRKERENREVATAKRLTSVAKGFISVLGAIIVGLVGLLVTRFSTGTTDKVVPIVILAIVGMVVYAALQWAFGGTA